MITALYQNLQKHLEAEDVKITKGTYGHLFAAPAPPSDKNVNLLLCNVGDWIT